MMLDGSLFHAVYIMDISIFRSPNCMRELNEKIFYSSRDLKSRFLLYDAVQSVLDNDDQVSCFYLS